MTEEIVEVCEDGLLMALFAESGDLLISDTPESIDKMTIFNIPNHEQGRPEKAINLDDFSKEESTAFLSLYQNIREAIRMKADRREHAVNWIFVPNFENDYGLTFSLCCTALSVREGLLRTRTQYEFYTKGIITKLPFLAVAPPESFDLEAGGVGEEAAQDMIYLLWNNPGLRADYFRDSFKELDETLFQKVTLDLECNGLIAMKSGCWYFTGRNPMVMKFGTGFDWAKVPIF